MNKLNTNGHWTLMAWQYFKNNNYERKITISPKIRNSSVNCAHYSCEFLVTPAQHIETTNTYFMISVLRCRHCPHHGVWDRLEADLAGRALVPRHARPRRLL